MTISESELKTLHQLVTQDQALLARVQAAATAQEVAQLITQAACAQGLGVTPEALLPHIEDAAPPPQSTALTEAQLDDVAGGATYTININNTRPIKDVYFFQPPITFPGNEHPGRDWVLRQWFHRP